MSDPKSRLEDAAILAALAIALVAVAAVAHYGIGLGVVLAGGV